MVDQRALKKLIRLIEEFPSIVKDRAQKNDYFYKKKAKQDMESIARRTIDLFYGDYDPHKYDRWGDLYNAFKVTVNDKVWKIEYKSSFMKYPHRASNEYIFMLSFVSGYHGGAINGPDHPAPGTLYGPNLIGQGIPYYRTFPYYKAWSRPAVKSESPYLKIEEDINKYFEDILVEMDDKFRAEITPYMDAISLQIQKTFK